jgi:hypothetical protein
VPTKKRENGNSAIMKTGLHNFVILQMGFTNLSFSNDAHPQICSEQNFDVI